MFLIVVYYTYIVLKNDYECSLCVSVIQGEVGHIVMSTSEKQVLVVDKRKLLLPPLYNKMFSWGYMDQSARISLVEGEKKVK